MILNRRRFVVTAACAAGLAAIAPHAGLAATAAESFVNKVANGVIAAAETGSIGQFRSLLRQNADIASIALFSLGAYRQNLSASQRSEYYQLVEQHISTVFASHSSKLRGRKLTVSGSRNASDSVIVDSRLHHPDGRSVPVIWRVVQRGGGYKIFDVNVDGVWLANTQRTSFTSVLQKNGGDVGALMQHLRN